MAQIGYGYGSEFHLMRFLGHHRDLLERRISQQIKEVGIFNWLDFEFEKNPLSSICGDKELKGLSFLKRIGASDNQIEPVISEYHSYSINKINSWQNWDAIFTLNGTLYLVEAKAHVSEISSGNIEHGDSSKDEILRFFTEQLGENTQYNFPVTREWLRNYYQLANRMATAALLNKHGIKTKVLYIYFINGYDKRIVDEKKVVRIYEDNASKSDYEKAIEKEERSLGIYQNERLAELLAPPVFINAYGEKYTEL